MNSIDGPMDNLYETESYEELILEGSKIIMDKHGSFVNKTNTMKKKYNWLSCAISLITLITILVSVTYESIILLIGKSSTVDGVELYGDIISMEICFFNFN
jgi:hypothetical protein